MNRSRSQWNSLLALVSASAACSLLAPDDRELLGTGPGISGSGGTIGGRDGAAGPDAGGDGAPSAGGTAGTSGDDASAPGGTAGIGGTAGSGGSSGPSDAADGDDGSHAVVPQRQLLLWLTAENGLTTVGSSVSSWSDRSPNRANATQSIAVARPEYSREGALDSVAFDGIDDSLVLPRGFANFTEGLSFFAVALAHVEQDCPSILHLSNNPEEDDIAIGRHEGSLLYEVQNDAVVGPEGAFELGAVLVLSVVHSIDGGVELRMNGQFMASSNFPLPANLDRANNFIARSLYSGCDFFDGHVFELLLYARALDLPEREGLEAYLRTKWSSSRQVGNR
jgi:hypothetical protein